MRQRLKYLGYDGWGGTTAIYDGAKFSPVDTTANFKPGGVIGATRQINVSKLTNLFGPPDSFNLKITGDPPLIEAIRLFQSAITGPVNGKEPYPFYSYAADTGAKTLSYSQMSGSLSPGDIAAQWLNAKNAPSWVDLYSYSHSVSSPYSFSVATHGANPAGQPERFGTSWIAEIFSSWIVAAHNNVVITAASNAYSDTLSTSHDEIHGTHKEGLAADVRIPYVPRICRSAVGTSGAVPLINDSFTGALPTAPYYSTKSQLASIANNRMNVSNNQLLFDSVKNYYLGPNSTLPAAERYVVGLIVSLFEETGPNVITSGIFWQQQCTYSGMSRRLHW